MMELTGVPKTSLCANAQAFLENLGLKTTGTRLHPDHTDEVPQVVVDLATNFPDSYPLLEKYTKDAGGTVSQYDWTGAPYNLGDARFSFEGNRSMLLVSAAGRHACVLRNNDDKF